jgi:hypothetical protein
MEAILAFAMVVVPVVLFGVHLQLKERRWTRW